jgi:hypothetical protein
MGYLRINSVAEQPPNNAFIEVLLWFKENAFVWTSFALAWKGLDLAFKFLKDGRDASIRSIVQDEINKSMTPKLDNLSDKIERLGDAVFELKNRL